MTRTFYSLFIILFLAACGKSGGVSSARSEKSRAEVKEAEISMERPAPIQAQTFEINADLSGLEQDQEDKIRRAFDLIKRVVASDDFKRKILQKSYRGEKKFVDNQGLSNVQIYKKLLDGAEELNGKKNNAMDLVLKAYDEPARVIGYTKPRILTIFMNTRYLNDQDFSEPEVAMNLTHEWLHKLGFKHSAQSTPERPHSVPYAIGYIMRELAKEISEDS